MLMLECPSEDLKTIIGFIKSALGLVQIFIPIALIIWGTLDLGKAVIASDDKKIKESQQLLMKRAISAVLVFLVATLVSVLMGFVGNSDWQECWKNAKKCKSPNLVTGECCSYENENMYDSIQGKCK